MNMKQQPDVALEAVRLFNKGFNCAQAINMAFGASRMDQETFNKLAPFINQKYGDGIICGAVKGALDVLYHEIKSVHGDIDITPMMESVSVQFIESFLIHQRSLSCSALSSGFVEHSELCELSASMGQEVKKCSVFVHFSAQLVSEILREDKVFIAKK